MRRYWYRKILIIILICTIMTWTGYFFKEIQKDDSGREVSSETISPDMLIPGGMPIGIYLETEGVMVLGTGEIDGADHTSSEPAAHLVKAGDYIVACNGTDVHAKKELQNILKNLSDDEARLKIRRNKNYLEVKIKPAIDKHGEKKLGIWVRDNAQGLGTITFLDAQSRFGALGHGIHDTDTNTLIEIKKGNVYDTSIRNIQKGKNGEPGGIEGVIVYNRYNILGNIEQNTDCGIFGKISRMDTLFHNQTPIEVAEEKEIKKGDAVIRCCIDGNVKDYKIRITKIDKGAKEENKGLEIEVTDPELLEITGGIIQGMSGAPIIQNEKIVGAVTHVFVNNPTKGYGIFIGNMLKCVE